MSAHNEMHEKGAYRKQNSKANQPEELGVLCGQPENEQEKAGKIVLTQNLEGFASCFPDWDLHPPLKRKENE